MPAEFELIRNGRVALFTYRDPLTIADIEAALDKRLAVLEEAKAPIHSIHDGICVTLLPPGFLSFTVNRGKRDPDNPKIGQAILVINRRFIHALIAAMTRLLPDRGYEVVKTLDDALLKVDEILEREKETEL